MGRAIFLTVIVWLGFVLLREYGWSWLGLEEQIAWALLLPGVYLAGMTALRD